MKNFFKVGEVNTMPLLRQLHTYSKLWNQNDLRTTYPGSAHAQADDIWLWFNEIKDDNSGILSNIDTVPYHAWSVLTYARPLVFDVSHAVESTRLGRAVLTRLAPGKAITPHRDEGYAVEYYNRYQVALQSQQGATFRIEDETVTFKTGEVWWIDNSKEHEVQNNSNEDRIVLILDLRVKE